MRYQVAFMVAPGILATGVAVGWANLMDIPPPSKVEKGQSDDGRFRGSATCFTVKGDVRAISIQLQDTFRAEFDLGTTTIISYPDRGLKREVYTRSGEKYSVHVVVYNPNDGQELEIRIQDGYLYGESRQPAVISTFEVPNPCS